MFLLGCWCCFIWLLARSVGTSSGPVPDRSLSAPASTEESRLQPQLCLLPANVGRACGGEASELDPRWSCSVVSSRTNFSKDPGGAGSSLWLPGATPPAQRHPSPPFLQPDSEPSPVLSMSPFLPSLSLPPSLLLSRYHPHRTSQKCADSGCWATLAYY